MSAETDDYLAALRTQIVALVRTETGDNEQVALRVASQILQALRHGFGGAEVYFPKPRRYDEAAVIADIDAGRSVRDVCRKHKIGKRTYYQIQRRMWHSRKCSPFSGKQEHTPGTLRP